MSELLAPLARWGLLAVVALAAVAAILLTVQHHDQGVLQQGRQQVERAVQATTDKALVNQRVQQQRTTDIQARARADAQRDQFLQDSQRADADAALDRVRQLAASGGRGAATTCTAASGAGAAGTAAGMVSADLFWSVVDQALEIGGLARDSTAAADSLERSGAEAATDYDALRPAAAPP